MKKWTVALIGLGLSSLVLVNPAMAEMGMDSTLARYGVIDGRYKYKDMADVERVFELMTVRKNENLPTPLLEGLEIQSVEYKPYYGVAKVVLLQPINEADRATFGQLLSNELTGVMCQSIFFNEQFMVANNYTMVFAFTDSEGHAIANITLSNPTCA